MTELRVGVNRTRIYANPEHADGQVSIDRQLQEFLNHCVTERFLKLVSVQELESSYRSKEDALEHNKHSTEFLIITQTKD